MEVIELSATEQEEIYRIVASVLHLGNTGFVEEEGRARLTNSMAVHTVAKVGSSKQCPDMIIDRGLLKSKEKPLIINRTNSIATAYNYFWS